MRPCPAHPVRLALTGLTVLCLTGPAFAQPTGHAPVLWLDRAASVGPEPGLTFRFVKESKSGTAPKFEVEDERGVQWKVKLGEEARPETAATRLLGVVGYLVEDAYYRAEMRVAGLPRLRRGRQFVSPDGVVRGARLEHAGPSAPSHTWSWYKNPFIGTREFNGLRVMMALINNWDLKEVNNSAPDEPGGDGRHRVTDLGATFGRTGNVLRRSKGNHADYAGAAFIAKVTATHVDFVLRSRPILLGLYNIRNYRSRTRMERVAKHVPLDDARWIGGVLGRLSRDELAGCFQGAGFTDAETDVYLATLQARIAELNHLPASAPPVAASPVYRGALADTPPIEAVSTLPRCQPDACRQAPLRERVTPFRIGTRHLRAVLGGFEQGAGLGGGVQATTADALALVELRVTALTSTHLFRRLELEALVPRLGSDRTHVAVRVVDLRREVDFSGIGPHTPAGAQTHFALAQHSYQGALTRDLSTQVQAGVYAQVERARTSRSATTADTPIDTLFSGTPGGPAGTWLPGFGSQTRVLSYGAFLAFDNRDDRVGLTRGLIAYVRVADASGLGASAGLTRYGWRETEADVRGFVPLGSAETSLLVRARSQLQSPKDNGYQIPFHDLSFLGGRAHLRGYRSYRFRATSVLLLSTELQRTIRALTAVRGIDVFAAADAGQAWGDSRPPGERADGDASFSRHNWRTGLGGGLQYRHSPRLAARLETSWSRERILTYASLSRGF